MPYTKNDLAAVALNEAEYEMIVERLGREPNHLELGIFGAMWSEHCGYKHSKPLLRQFPSRTESAAVLIEAGEENAGAVDIGDGQAIVFKVESHNHPSAIEPVEGAATGVGGIVRDIFTMGARPIALLNSLRFGPLDDPRNRFLFEGVVEGISGYGNRLGIPDVAGEIQFAAPYSMNPLVNAMCVGLVKHEDLVRARASGVGNSLMIVGAATGRDGIHGATFASVELDEKSQERRPAVQVGNAFLEKLLLEACLEILHSDDVVGLQDLGAAGLTSSTVEAADKGGSGVILDVAKVPRRETGMSAYEVMLSESQERMLVVVKAGRERAVAERFERWDLHASVIGVVTDDGHIRIRDGAEEVANLPVGILTSPPSYSYPVIEPAWLKSVQTLDVAAIPAPGTAGQLTYLQVLERLLAAPNIASRRPVYRRYDHQVQNNTVVAPGGGDAAVLRIKGTDKAIALAIDGNGRHCYLNPRDGGARVIAEATRNVVCSGATPLAVTDCLNFPNPERPDGYYQLAEATAGMAEACRALGVPVVSGNVSLYNESEQGPIYPTPIVGVLGLIDHVDRRLDAAFKQDGDLVLLLGGLGADDPDSLAGSEYLALIHGVVAGNPGIDLAAEVRLQKAVLAGAKAGLLRSAHDCADGGLAIAVAESCIIGGRGFIAGPLDLGQRADVALFGEAPSRIVVSCAAENVASVRGIAADFGVPVVDLGTVGGAAIAFGDTVSLPLESAASLWENGLAKAATGIRH